MNTPLVTSLQDLLKRGAKLIPDGGSEFSGYNAKRQSKYLLWRKNCLDAIGQLREKGTVLYAHIANDENGMYFYQSSAQKISAVVEDALEIARAIQEQAAAAAKAEEEQAAAAAVKAAEEQAAAAAAKADEELAAEKAAHHTTPPEPFSINTLPVLEPPQWPELSLAERLDGDPIAAPDPVTVQEPIAALEVISEAAAEPLVIDVPGTVREEDDDTDRQEERSHPDRWKTVEPPILMPDEDEVAPLPIEAVPDPTDDDVPAAVDAAPDPIVSDAQETRAPETRIAEATPVLVFASTDHPMLGALQAMIRERSIDCTLVAHTSGIWNSLPALDAMRPLPRYATFLLSTDHCPEELMALGYVAGRYPWLTLSCIHHTSAPPAALLPGISRFTVVTDPHEILADVMNELNTAGYSVSL